MALYDEIDFSPPAGVRSEAQRGLDWRAEYGRGGTEVGVARARDLSNGSNVSPDTARRMVSFFARHEVDKQGEGFSPGEDGFPSAGRVAWALWGGDPGQAWASKLVRQMDAEDEEYRTMTIDIERRDLCHEIDDELIVESRADGRAVIIGYAAVYNRLSLDLGGFREMILPGAFDKVLGRQRGLQDVVALFNHNSDMVLGRTSSGTLELSSDDKGLKYVVTPPASRADVLELIQRRDVKGSSFAFTVDSKGESFSPDEKGNAIRNIREVSGLYDVGPVLVPAYPASTASVAMRSYQTWLSSREPVASRAQKSLMPFAAVAASLRLRSQMRG